MEKFIKPSRNYQSRIYTMRFDMDGENDVVGYAAVFDKWSRDLGGFKEIIKPGAFRDVLQDDVVALFNHRADNVLGRASSGTVEIWEDDEGLGYRIKLPNTQLGRDMRELISRGDIKESSFGFDLMADDSQWDFADDGSVTHTISRIARLWDVSPVTWAAYPDTGVSVERMQRALEAREAIKEEAMNNEFAYRQRQIHILSLTT